MWYRHFKCHKKWNGESVKRARERERERERERAPEGCILLCFDCIYIVSLFNISIKSFYDKLHNVSEMFPTKSS